MSDYINENADIFNEDENKGKKTPLAIRIIKWLGVAIILIVVGLLFARCIIHRDHELTDKLLMNESFIEEYKKNPDELIVRKYGMPSPWEDVKQGRIIEFDELYHIPKTRQLQLSIKYNEDIVPESVKGFPFIFQLVDENGNVFDEYWYEHGNIMYFNHIRVCFENIDIETGELDDKSNPVRHSYTLKILMNNGKGSYDEICTYSVFDGKSDKTLVYKVIEYEVED